MKGARVALSIATALLLAVAGQASAAFSIGAGETPSVAVDDHGIAHVVWVPTDPTGHTLMECNMPRGAVVCSAPPTTLSLPAGDMEQFGTTGGPPQIFSSEASPGGPVYVVVIGNSGNGASSTENEWVSSDGGATFSGPTAIGTLLATDSVLDGQLVIGASNSPGSSLASPGANPPQIAAQANPLSGGQNTAFATLEPSTFQTDTTQTVIGVAGGFLAAAWNDAESNGGLYYSHLNAGVPITPTGINKPSDWTTTRLGDGGTNIGMAGGPAGLWLLESIPGHGDYPALRKFDGQKFGSLRRVDCGDINHFGAGLQDQWLYQDSRFGRLNLAYVGSDNGRETLRYVELLPSVFLAQSVPITIDVGSNYLSPRIATNGTGAGLVVWFTQFGDTSQIQGAWLPLPLPQLSGCPAVKTSRTIGRTKVTVTTPSPYACLAPPQSLGVGLKASGKGKVTRAEYDIDGHKVKTATKLQSVQLSIAGLKSGGHQLTVKVNTSKHKTGSLKASFSVC